jgi:hypothetical protein
MRGMFTSMLVGVSARGGWFHIVPGALMSVCCLLFVVCCLLLVIWCVMCMFRLQAASMVACSWCVAGSHVFLLNIFSGMYNISRSFLCV